MTKKPNPKTDARLKPVLTQIQIVDEPFIEQRTCVGSAYDAFFDTLPFNHRIKCPSDKTQAIAKALRTWIAIHYTSIKRPVIRSRTDCGDGFGGVWWLEGEAPQRNPKVKTTLADGATWPHAT